MNLIEVLALAFFIFALLLTVLNIPLSKLHPDKKTERSSVRSSRFIAGVLFMALAAATYVFGYYMG
jgi:hypothetical protein